MAYQAFPDIAEQFKSLESRISALERTKHHPPPAGLRIFSAEIAAEVTTTSIPFVDLGGPSISLSVSDPRGLGGLLMFWAQAEMLNDPGGASAARVSLFEPTHPIYSGNAQVLERFGNVYSTMKTAPGTGPTSGVGLGTPALSDGGVLIERLDPGDYTFSLRYRVNGGTGYFRNRKLWIGVLGADQP